MLKKRSNLNAIIFFTLILIGCNEIEKSRNLIEKGEIDQAIIILRREIRKRPQNLDAHLLLADALIRSDQIETAIKLLKNGIDLFPAEIEKVIRIRLKLSEIYSEIGQSKQILHQFRQIVRSTDDQKIIDLIVEDVTDRYRIKQLTSGKSDNYSPNFSPDGDRIVFSSFRSGNSDLFVMDTNGRVRQRVTFTTDFNESFPNFVGDSDHVVYTRELKSSRQISVVLQGSGSSRLYASLHLTHIFNKRTFDLLNTTFGLRSPTVSKDHRHILFEQNVNGDLEIFEIDFSKIDLDQISLDAIEKRQITDNDSDDGSPFFFPSGDRIIFASARDRVPHQIFAIDLDGKNETQIYKSDYDCYSPIISQDGSRIIFVAAKDGDLEIFEIDRDGKNPRSLTNGIGVSIQPTFSPDGSKLAFVSDRSDNFQIYLMDLNFPISRLELLQMLK